MRSPETVAELVAILLTMPQDAAVQRLTTSEYGWIEVRYDVAANTVRIN